MNALPHPGVETFMLPRSILKNRNLKTLSGNALSLFLLVGFRCYRKRSPQVQFTFDELFLELDLDRNDIKRAAKELRAAKTLHFQQNETAMMFHIQTATGSKAKIYLHELGEQPAQDANIAQTNIEVV